jgi:hypothetical protein
MKAEIVEAVVGQGGAMPIQEALPHRVRYFCGGAVLGTVEYVNSVFEREQALRKRFGEKRTAGARRIRGRIGASRGCCGCCGICRRT